MTTTQDRETLNHDDSGGAADVATFAAYGLALNQVGISSWLVRTMDPISGPLSLVACIDLNSLGFEVMELDSGFQWTAFTSLAEVAGYLAVKSPER